MLKRIDLRFNEAVKEGEADILCKKGCFECCRGVFEISLFDALLIAKRGMNRAFAKDTYKNAQKFYEDVSHRGWEAPHFIEQLDDGDVADRMMDLDEVNCPLLNKNGACRIYAQRPSICRFQGIPFIDVDSGQVLEDECPIASRDRHRVSFKLIEYNNKESELFQELGEIVAGLQSLDISDFDTLIADAVHWSKPEYLKALKESLKED